MMEMSFEFVFFMIFSYFIVGWVIGSLMVDCPWEKYGSFINRHLILVVIVSWLFWPGIVAGLLVWVFLKWYVFGAFESYKRAWLNRKGRDNHEQVTNTEN